ncbi:MAG: hypothetical protein A3F54_02110 [Candidatus Kerfeldbacteria bacterium RIFCSPHIGHO2_12_FULL_48_17]|uniref:Uncharacterized protein n=1 Tax=Candidatus Kerfeldbacteria bacterium RIFCSPHIGHO2_12_FULL_48_17 TaxID=1798542 RepID=A0A1G2AYA2_9BACT|nr:MAG: hypothetical protein A3F54_02110 [Candidatus Kerfeldbacteria bacterium RIFCSPHIGHO2_12_FULL_48_17]
MKLSAVRLRRLSGFSRGEFLAACGGEMRSNTDIASVFFDLRDVPAFPHESVFGGRSLIKTQLSL